MGRFAQLRQASQVGGGLNGVNGDNHLFSDATAPDKTAIERQIAVTDKQIDQLVYERINMVTVMRLGSRRG